VAGAESKNALQAAPFLLLSLRLLLGVHVGVHQNWSSDSVNFRLRTTTNLTELLQHLRCSALAIDGWSCVWTPPKICIGPHHHGGSDKLALRMRPWANSGCANCARAGATFCASE
jgi:hypothetical protein